MTKELKPQPAIPANLGKAELEANVRTSQLWAESLRRATISANDAAAIGSLIAFLEDTYKRSLAEYEAAMVKHPEWGRPKDLEQVASA